MTSGSPRGNLSGTRTRRGPPTRTAAAPKSVDLAVLRTVTRKIIVAWTVLSADAPGRAVSTVLDDALLSARTLDEAVRLPLRRFWEHAQ
jgi:hypothetical protein